MYNFTQRMRSSARYLSGIRMFLYRNLFRYAVRYFSRYPIETLRRVIFPYRDEPFLHLYGATVQKYSTVHATGKSFFSELDALASAYGEAIERFSYYEFSPEEYIDAPYRDMKSKNNLDIFSLAGFSPQQKQGDERLRFDERTQFRFITEKNLITGSAARIPLQLVSPKHFRSATRLAGRSVAEKTLPPSEPILRVPITTGVAAGRSEDEVVCNGILECIERDAFMLTYMNEVSPPQINVRSLDIRIQGQSIGDYLSFFQLEVL